jgi:hypothetical protein
MGTTWSNSKYQGTSVTINNGVVIAGESVLQLTLGEAPDVTINGDIVKQYTLILPDNQYLNYSGSGTNFQRSNDPDNWRVYEYTNGFTLKVASTSRYIRKGATNSNFACYAINADSQEVYMYIEDSGEPSITVPGTLTLKEPNSSFNVIGQNLIDNIGVSFTQNPDNLFSMSLSGNVNWGFERDANNEVNGTVTVYYNDRHLTAATGTIRAATDKDATGEDLEKFVTVTYQPDLYIYADLGSGWGYPEDAQMDYADGVYTKTVTITNPGSCILFAKAPGLTYNWDDNRLFFGAKWDADWIYGTDNTNYLALYGSGSNNQYYPIKFNQAGVYTITIDAEAEEFTVTSTSVNTIAAAIAKPENDTFTFMGNAVVTYQSGNNLWIRDASGSGLINGSVGVTFENGEILAPGWSAKNTIYNSIVPRFTNPANVAKGVGSAEANPFPLTELTENDMNKYVSLSNVTVTTVSGRQYNVTVGDKQAILYDQFQLFTQNPLVVGYKYNVEGVVTFYNGAPELYLTKVEEIKALRVTLESETTTAATGETIPVTVNVENAEGDCTITYKFGENGTETTLTGNTINVTSETAGDVTLYVTVTNNGNVATASETYTFTAPLTGNNVFTKVKSADQLVANKRYIIVYDNKAMGTSVITGSNNGQWLAAVDVTAVSGDDVQVGDDVAIMTMGGSLGSYTLALGDKYLHAVNNTTLGFTGEATNWAISDYNGTLNGYRVKHADNSRAVRYSTSSKDRFGNYALSDNNSDYGWIYVEKASTPEPDPMTISLTDAPAEPYTVGDNVTVTATVENGTENTAVTYKIGEGEWQNYPEGGIVLPNTAAGDVVVTVKASDGTNEATDEVTYHFNAAKAFEITLTATPAQETYKVNDVVNVKVAVANALVENPTITYTIGETREAATYDPETGINVTSATAGTVKLTVNVTDGYEHAGESSMTANYVFVKKDITLAFGDETPTSVYKGNEITLTVTGAPEGATVTFECTPENAVTFDGNKATFNTEGEVTITAKTAETAEYNAGTATYTITVEPKPYVMAEPTSLDFVTVIGNDPVSKTFTVMAENLKEDIALTMTESNVFTFTPATIAKADMTDDGVVVTVTYNPTAATGDDLDEASITLKTKDAKDVTVSLTGMATLPDPVLTVTPGTLEMGTNPTGTFTVTGQHLTEDVTLTVTEGTAANFVITPANITPDEEGKVNQEITVTYKGNSTEDEYATITVKSGIAKKEVTVSARVLPTPELIADPESLTMTAVVGQTPATATFTVMATDLRGDITLTLSETDAFTINPATIAKADMTEDGVEVTVTYTPTQAGNDNATITIASEAAESVTVTLNGTATVPEVVAAPTFSLVAGSYTGAQTMTISCATEGATILYSTDGGSTWTAGNTVNVDKDMTIMAKAEKDGYTNSATVTAAYIIDIPEELPTITPFKGYYQIKNNGNGMYANIAGRKTLNFTDAENAKKMAGTVIWLETNDKGQVQSLRSQAADLQGYANRAMRYVPQMVDIVVNKINEMEGIEDATGAGSVLGENGLDEIMAKFNECFDYHLYVEQAQGGWRLYGKTPNMQHVVDFYRDHKDQVEAKLPKLEKFINDALHKLINKIGGSTVFTDFSLRQIWENMGGTLTEPVDEASIMAFYREVLNNKNYVWDFAYQTAQIYWGNVKSHPRYDELKAQLGEYADYIDEFVNQVRPDFKYYVIQRGDEPDYISEGNGEIISNDPRTLWTLEPRTGFTVNIAGEQFGCPYAGGVGGYATTNYTDFAYTVPEGVTAYKVASVENGVANLQALSGVIPAQTPVLLMAKEAKDYVLTLSTEAGTKVTGNLLVGVDSLITRFQLKTPMVETLFSLAKGVLGEQLYNQYVAQYEYLQLLYAGTVNNKYFWGLTRDDVMKCLNANGDDCVVRDLSGSKFIDNRQVKTNKAFLVSETDQTIIISTLRGDVNHDGYVNIDDVTALIDYLLEVDGRACPYCANVNCDSTVNIVDVTYLIDILLGNISPYAEGGNGN